MKPTQYFLDCKLIETIEQEERLAEIVSEAKNNKHRIIMQYGNGWDNLNVYTYGLGEEKPQGFKSLIAALKELSK